MIAVPTLALSTADFKPKHPSLSFPLVRPQSKDYNALVVFCIFFGISYGMVGALQFEVLMAIVGTEKFSSAIGLVLLMEAIAVLVGPPGAGK